MNGSSSRNSDSGNLPPRLGSRKRNNAMPTDAQDVVVRAEAVAGVTRPEAASSSEQVRAMARFLEVRFVMFPCSDSMVQCGFVK